jgi:phosphonate transport system ATP-binding protein
MTPTTVFNLSGVSRRYGASHALDNVSLTIRQGEHVAIIGPSGAGKSTLIGMLNGTEAPTTGEVIAFGQSLNHLCSRARREVQRRIGTIHQGFYLVDNLRVIHNVNAGHLGRWSSWRALASLLYPRDRTTARQALARVGIADKLDAVTGRLSGGEQQRVALARVLVQDPDAVLADEPISHLDQERGREIMDLLRDLCLEKGKTLVASCHSVSYVRSHFQRVVGLRAGRVLFDCSVADLSPARIRSLYLIEGEHKDVRGSLHREAAVRGNGAGWPANLGSD